MTAAPTTTKTAQLVAFMQAGDWTRALSLASTFRMLGPHKATIHRAHAARTNPAFYRGLGRDPAATIAAGIAALQALYPDRTPTKETHHDHADEPVLDFQPQAARRRVG